ncbi:aminotransferase class I/II-fold pyridoxal phosphate-dependent enzyme, partial [Streptomyces albidoflavus]
MTESWANLGIDLHLEPAGPGLRKGLTDALREAVRSGRLAPGTRLPSSRTLAGDLGIARNTVADAYADLVAEGHLTARQGSGTRVAEQAGPASSVPRRRRPVRVPDRAGPAHDLTPGTPDLSAFPRAAWLKAARRALTAAPNDAFGYGDPRGRPELRAALAEYLARVRGVAADPERIVVCAGVAHGLKLVTEVL